ncbi:hypothetical protein PFISCL1PPCAC_20758, partial [Pristionchus fissidentatus]
MISFRLIIPSISLTRPRCGKLSQSRKEKRKWIGNSFEISSLICRNEINDSRRSINQPKMCSRVGCVVSRRGRASTLSWDRCGKQLDS